MTTERVKMNNLANLPFTIDQLNAAVEAGRVTSRPHPTRPLNIYNYSKEMQWTQDWDDITMACRGLILDHDYNVVARPWSKFFNLGQVETTIDMDAPVEVMDKADGSLGILYPDAPGIVSCSIATRGSFASEQAQMGTLIWKARYTQHDRAVMVSGMTYLFEIIYPSNRIVLDYGDQQELILLGAVQKGTGNYYGPDEAAAFINWTGPVVEIMPYNTIAEASLNLNRKNAEGYVIRQGNVMTKLKQDDYIELHKLVTNASPKTVWEQLREGKSKDEIVSAFPDEFHDYIASMADPLIEAFEAREQSIYEGYVKAVIEHVKSGGNNRGDFARLISSHPDKGYFFRLLDNREIDGSLWTELRPTAD